MGIFRIGISHDDRDGGSKCVTTGSIQMQGQEPATKNKDGVRTIFGPNVEIC